VTPFVLPLGVDVSAWEVPLALAEFEPVAQLEAGGGVRLDAGEGSWVLHVYTPDGERVVLVAAPASPGEREDLALLARSLLAGGATAPLRMPRDPSRFWAEVGGGGLLHPTQAVAPAGEVAVGVAFASLRAGLRAQGGFPAAIPALGEGAATGAWWVVVESRWELPGRVVPSLGAGVGAGLRSWILEAEPLVLAPVPVVRADAGILVRAGGALELAVGLSGTYEAAEATVRYGEEEVPWVPVVFGAHARVRVIFPQKE
jgi:hypothetical protein